MQVIDNILVGLALLVSIGYAAMSLGPKSLRRFVLTCLSRLLARAPASGMRRAAQRLALAAGSKQSGSCGGCDSCDSQQPASGPEVKIPVTKIGRRV
jgi:hypothetical protein